MTAFSIFIFYYCLTMVSAILDYTSEERSQRGLALLNHTYKSVYTEDYPSCLKACIDDFDCMSLNYWWRDSKCDLNNKNKYSAESKFFIPDITSTYMGLLREPVLLPSPVTQLKSLTPTQVVILPSSSSVVASITTNVPPSVTVDSQSKTVEEGWNVMLTCNATGQPQPKVTWNKSEGSLPVSRIIIENATLTIMNAHVDDSGLHVCTANNSVGSNASVVDLKVIRLSINISTSLLVYIGQNKTILCPVPTNPNPIVLWRYNKTSDLPEGVEIEGPKVLKIASAKTRNDGNYICIARNSSSSIQSTARVTVQIRYPETCSRVKAKISDVSGHYVIDPDGVQGMAPFEVFCNMTDKGGIGVTVVSHDSEKRTHVNGCMGDGCYQRDVTYIGASLSQLTALTVASARCEQFISYECKSSKLFRGGKAWWVSRDGDQMEYWGGATNHKDYCACGLTNTCAKGEKCNCDADEYVWLEDSGLLTDKSSLPVSQLRFGDTDKEEEEGYHILGKLICYITA